MKKGLKNIMLWLMKVGIAGCIAVIILCVISMFYSYTGVHVASKTGATDYTWEPNQWRTTMEEGFAWIRMDQNGYNNAQRVDDSDINILLMGSSHMEALNVGAEQNTGYRLNQLIADCYTYNIGISGHTIYHCVSNLGDAVQTFHPSEWIIIETSQVALDMEEMRRVIDGEYAAIPSYDGGMMYGLQKFFPAVKIVYNKLTDWRNLESDSEDVAGETMGQTVPAKYEKILGQFLSFAASALEENQKLLIFYQPNTSIRADGSFAVEDDGMAKLFEQACEDAGILFVDMTQDFKQMYEERRLLAHGFTNTAVGAGHLNTYGHEAIAQRLASVIEAENEGEGGTVK